MIDSTIVKSHRAHGRGQKQKQVIGVQVLQENSHDRRQRRPTRLQIYRVFQDIALMVGAQTE